jgi:hypothetical protein
MIKKKKKLYGSQSTIIIFSRGKHQYLLNTSIENESSNTVIL